MSRVENKNGRDSNRKTGDHGNLPSNSIGRSKLTQSAKSLMSLQKHTSNNLPAEPPDGHGDEKRFNVLVDSVPYIVTVVPFDFNGEARYRVTFNGSTVHVFAWDSSLGQHRAIDDDSSTLPDNLELAISDRLVSIKL